MKRIVIVSIFLILATMLISDTVARVEDYKISYEQLSDAMTQYKGAEGLSFAEVRQLCLNRLIDEQVLIHYARENNISIADDELDAFFIRELGNHERFQTNGMFDYFKYEEFKDTETGYKILTEMKRELLINKTKTLVMDYLKISDETLLQQYILENVELDLGYAQVRVEQADATEDFTNEGALEYYYDHKREFKTPKQVKFEFVLIPKEDFQAEAEIYYDNILQSIFFDENNVKQVNADSLKTVFVEKEKEKLALSKSREILDHWQKDASIDYPILKTPFLSKNDTLGCIDQEIIKEALKLKETEFSDPLKISNYGFIVLRILELKKPELAKIEEIRSQIWKSYLEYEKNRLYSKDFKRYFINNIDDFIVPAAVVYKIEISRPKSIFSLHKEEYQSSLRSLIEANKDDEIALEEISEDYGLKNSNHIILLDKFKNNDEIDQQIAERIKKSKHSGFITSEKDLFFYQVSTFFPEYIPNFEDIENEINDLIYVEQLQNSDYQEYYDEHKKDFSTPDSLKIGGVFFPIITDTLEIEAPKIREFYDSNINSFYRERTVKFDYIYTNDYETAKIAREQAISGINLNLLNFCYGKNLNLTKNKSVSFASIPDKIASILSTSINLAYSEIFKYADGFIFLYKLEDYPAGLRNFAEVKAEIRDQFLHETADSIAFYQAKTVFDSTRYFSQCMHYAPEENLFKTSLLPVESRFEYLGKLNEYKDELLRMWKNEKYSSIIKLDSGYAVIYLLERTYSRQLTFEESLSEIKDIFAARKKYRTAKEFLNRIRERIITGDDPEELLYFLGGWHREFDLNLQSEVFPAQYNHLIMNDISKRETGYCSPIISPVADQLLFYQIERMNKVSNQQFEKHKNQFREKVMTERYKNWMSQYKSKLEIKVRI